MKAQMKAQVKTHKLRNTFSVSDSHDLGCGFCGTKCKYGLYRAIYIYLPAFCNRWFVFDSGYYST